MSTALKSASAEASVMPGNNSDLMATQLDPRAKRHDAPYDAAASAAGGHAELANAVLGLLVVPAGAACDMGTGHRLALQQAGRHVADALGEELPVGPRRLRLRAAAAAAPSCDSDTPTLG